MQPKHSAIVAGLTLALSFGAVAAPATAIAEEPTPGVASDATDIDKGLYTQQSFSGVLRSVQGVSFVNVTDEMKYFTKYESHGNYNQGFSYGDGYNALGYYQFDRRWSLIPFMKQVYNYDSAKYGMLKAAIDRGSEISNGSNPMYANGQLTELGRVAQDAFLGAYNTDPAEFSALQDAYAYNSYYAVTESWLKNALGIDISGRADCVEGMVWSITNMCGTGGCQDFFRWANLSNDMTDREFATALSNSVVDNVARKYSSQPQYHEGWKNRYKNELKDCLVYIAEDEATAATPVEPDPEPAPAPGPSMAPAAPAAPTPGTDGDAAIAAIPMRPRLIRAAMMPVTAGLRLVVLLPAMPLVVRRLLALTALRAARLLALPIRALLTALVIPLPMLGPLTVLAPMLLRAVRARAPMPAIPRRKIGLLPASSLAPCLDRL